MADFTPKSQNSILYPYIALRHPWLYKVIYDGNWYTGMRFSLLWILLWSSRVFLTKIFVGETRFPPFGQVAVGEDKYANFWWWGGGVKDKFTNLMSKNTKYNLIQALFIMKMYFRRTLRLKKGKFCRKCYKNAIVQIKILHFHPNFFGPLFTFFSLSTNKTEEIKI